MKIPMLYLFDDTLILSFEYAVLNISLVHNLHCHQTSYSWHNCILQFANPFKQIAKRKFLSLSTLDHDMHILILKPSIAVLICNSKIFVSNKKTLSSFTKIIEEKYIAWITTDYVFFIFFVVKDIRKDMVDLLR